jgi:hypothetical protein
MRRSSQDARPARARPAVSIAGRTVPWSLLFLALATPAQTVIGNDQDLATDTPEAWAMRYFAATTLLTSFGEAPKLAPWRWSIAGDLGSIPALNDVQRHVGFGGFKEEDLNKSPVFGRLRFTLGLPYDWVAELGYTPPLEINGSRPRNVFALAVGRRVLDLDGLSLSVRALGQVGTVRGDITCPARLAGAQDPVLNPYGCKAPSKDTFTTDYYGADATLGWDAGGWTWHGSAGIARTRLAVQVDAQVFAINDRSHLTSNGNLPWFTVGVRRDLDPHWSAAVEFLYVPLNVRRPPDLALDSDPLRSVRMQLRYAID